MTDQKATYGIERYKVPELTSDIEWVDGAGNGMEPIKLTDHSGTFKVLYGFSNFCLYSRA